MRVYYRRFRWFFIRDWYGYRCYQNRRDFNKIDICIDIGAITIAFTLIKET